MSPKMAYLAKKKSGYFIREKYKIEDVWKTKWIKIGDVPFARAKAILARYQTDRTFLRLGLDSPDKLTISEAIQQYEEFHKATPTKKPETVACELRLLRQFSLKFGKVKIDKIDCDAVNRWFVEMKHQPNTVRLYIAAIRQAYSVAAKRGQIETIPLSNLHKPKILQKPPKHVDDDIIDDVFAEIAPTAKPMFLIMLFAGLRPSEAMKLRVENVNLKTNTIDLYPDQTKTASRGLIPIHKSLIPIFIELIGKKKKTDWLFAGKNGHQVEYKKALQRACSRASKKHGKKIYITAYQLRHTFATRVLDKTNDLRTVQQLLRHTNISMTTRYATALEHKLRSAIDQI